MKRFLVLSTGGTIASESGEYGFAPKMSMSAIIESIPEIHNNFQYECKSVLNMDSSNIQPEEWKIIAKAVWENRNDYSAIIVTHGTDTMSYTASMLSFMLLSIKIPVIFTGSQIPFSVEGNDAIKNLKDSFYTANSDIRPGIYVVFDGKIMLGCRSKKLRTQSLNAFESINYPDIGTIDGNVVTLNDKRNFSESYPDKLFGKINKNVFLLKLIPGTHPDIFDMLAKMDYDGVVIEAFGIGGLHYIRRDLPKKINNLLEKNVEIVVVSQCPYELSDLTVYEVGQKVAGGGVISGRDMTVEATVTKLMWALANKTKDMSVSQIMQKNYCGEIE